jgi:hypothetical protein
VKPGYFLPDSFEGAIISRTNLQFLTSLLPKSFESMADYNSHRSLINNDFSRLPEIARLAGPKFIFAHIVAPHPPFVFNATGDAIDPNYGFTLLDTHKLIGDTSHYIRGYVEQLTYVNKRTLFTIDGITRNSKTPPIIILQADHGPAIQHYYFTIDELSVFERYLILKVFYLPGGNPGDVPDDITPVNSIRLKFNQYFNANFELLPNHQYFPSGMILYQFQDVTDKQP